MMQIILLAKGTGGDVFPFLTIGEALQSRGHVVTLATHSVHENLALAAGLGFLRLDTFTEYRQMQQEDHLLLQPRSTLLYHRRHVFPRILGVYELIKEHTHDHCSMTSSMFFYQFIFTQDPWKNVTAMIEQR